MRQGKFSTYTEFGILLALTGLGVILGGLLQMLVLQPYLPDGLAADSMNKEVLRLLADPANEGLARLSQALGAVCIFLIPSALYIFITKGYHPIWFGFSKNCLLFQFLAAFAILFCANLITAPIDHAVNVLVQKSASLTKMAGNMEEMYTQNLQMLGSFDSTTDWILTVALMALLPAFGEELFFRSVVQQSLTKWWGKPIASIIATAVLFSLIHFSILLFAGRAVLGIALGIIFHYTGNIWINIAAHFLNNAIAIMQLYWLQKQNKPYEPTSFNPPEDYIFSLLAMVIVFFIFSRLRKVSASLKDRILKEKENMEV
jgi:membrane protease YdiL (CAAX protease family)